MKYENQSCPVCNVLFNSEDDVVVCPECGTPHHRNCYFSNGGCKNEALHKEGYSYAPKAEAVNENKLDVIIEDDVKKTPSAKELINIEYDEENVENKEKFQQTIEDLFKNINGKTTDQVLINNIPSSYYEAAVGKNQNYYMPRFLIMERTNKKRILNVWAFIFPLAWSVYRKMYKLALLVFCIYIALMGVTVAPLMMDKDINSAMEQCIIEDPQCMENILLYQSGQSVTLTKNQAELTKLLNEFKISPVIIYGTFAVSLCMKILMGLYATNLYKIKLEKSIKKAENLFYSEKEKINYLKSKYGVIPMALAFIVGFIEYTFFGNF